MSDQARRGLASEQAALLHALLAGHPAPAGFDPRRLRIEADALRAKRRRTVERLRPDLVDELGEPRFAELFGVWAAAQPRRHGVSVQADADAFGAWVESHGRARRPWHHRRLRRWRLRRRRRR